MCVQSQSNPNDQDEGSEWLSVVWIFETINPLQIGGQGIWGIWELLKAAPIAYACAALKPGVLCGWLVMKPYCAFEGQLGAMAYNLIPTPATSLLFLIVPL